MQSKAALNQLTSAAAVFVMCLFATGAWAASHQLLHSFFPNGSDGAASQAGLIADGAGNLYGTTYYGGTYNAGAVFELLPQQGGGWTGKVLYSFKNDGRDGTFPYGRLLLDAAGNLYGTTNEGGIHCAPYGCGTVFELSPNGSGGWTETILHHFGNGSDGALPYAGLISDGAGNLYGTTNGGGVNSAGTVFELSPRQGGGWTETILHNFNFLTSDGTSPYCNLILDGAGNLYGTTQDGGIHGFGTAFELSLRQGGGWTEIILHNFGQNGSDGTSPYAGLLLDGAGNLYGTTIRGGIHNTGTAFELSPRQGGGWTETILHSFSATSSDGATPYSALVNDGAGNLYGTTNEGGVHGFGTAFELSPRQGGGWTETVLRSFDNSGTGGAYPYGDLLLDHAGNLYSTTGTGGSTGDGVVFELSPRQGGGWTETVLHTFAFNGTDGADPGFVNLIFDGAGNLYGTTTEGGIYDVGTVVKLTPQGAGGGWGETVIYNFGLGADGAIPYAGLVMDSAGNLYGTTVIGGIHGWGTAFELSPDGSGGWTEKVLHSFNRNGSDGAQPFSSLVFDTAGNLYGITNLGGIHDSGTAFQLSPNSNGTWTERVLHSFGGNNGDGSVPFAGLIIDSAGNLYGTTEFGGIYYAGGTVFELSPNGSGGWTEKVLHSFNYFSGTDGYNPMGVLLRDSAGNLYGTTTLGGIHGYGTVFQLTPRANGTYSEQVLHSFNGNIDGAEPHGNLASIGMSPNLYGVTEYGGVNGAGTVFELIPQGGNWTETVLHNFFPAGGDAGFPSAGLVVDGSGNLYGTAGLGGTYNSGAVFEVSP